MKIKAESGITTEAAPVAASGSPAVRKKGTPRSSRGCIPKKMRHPMTPAQRSFLTVARSDPRLHGRISRNQWVGRDLVDLVCHDARLVIEFETDPPIADSVKAARVARDARIHGFGYRVLRVVNSRVLADVRAVLDLVARTIDRSPTGNVGNAAVSPTADRNAAFRPAAGRLFEGAPTS
jgi:very-short-patch-repair endonuclease